MNHIIRPISENDVGGFHAALDAVAREKKYLAFLEAPPLESTREFVLGNIRRGDPQFVALDGQKVVGWCDINRVNRPVSRHVGVLGIGLLPDWRGRGIGRKLMQTTIDDALKKGFSRIELTVRESNGSAIALYKKLGFETEGLKKNTTLIDGAYENVYMMALLAP